MGSVARMAEAGRSVAMRMTASDLRVIRRLKELTGCGMAAVIRIAMREMLARLEREAAPADKAA